MRRKAVILNPRDNVATSLDDLKAGENFKFEIDGEVRAVRLTSDIPFGHKFSLFRIECSSAIIKYGEVIGTATAAIEPGDYVHVHNVLSIRGRGDLAGGVK